MFGLGRMDMPSCKGMAGMAGKDKLSICHEGIRYCEDGTKFFAGYHEETLTIVGLRISLSRSAKGLIFGVQVCSHLWYAPSMRNLLLHSMGVVALPIFTRGFGHFDHHAFL